MNRVEQAMLQNRNNLAPTFRHDTAELLRLALPLIAVTTSRMLMGFIDVTMVSRLGTDALAAILPAALMMWAFICFGCGVGTSVQTFASQADGRGEPERGAAYAWQTLYFGLALVPVAYCSTKLVPGLYAFAFSARSTKSRSIFSFRPAPEIPDIAFTMAVPCRSPARASGRSGSSVAVG